jgi:hypothetical protein
MEFKTRISSTFIMNMFLIALALGMAVISFFYASFRYPFFHYSYLIWLIIAYVRFRTYRRYIYLILNNKPVLIINESYVYDGAKKIKYYWKDIEEVYDDNAYLYLKLHNPEEYLNKLGNPANRFTSEVFSNVHKTPFVINTDMVNVNANVFLEILNNYSDQAFDLEN